VPVLADDDVIVHRDAERPGDVDDLLRHLDVGAARRRIAGRMLVQEDTAPAIELPKQDFSAN
jgi:hypothetical protein